MKYYEICMGDGDPRFCHPYINPNSQWVYESLAQNELTEIHELPIPMVVDNKYIPYDHLVSN